jgi:ATP-binding protein involved in chromosome partitioning
MSQMPQGGPMGQKIELPGVRHIIAVASGKGGVGKSTVTVNLAMALKQQGHAVGLMDADIYGPSLPTMMGISADAWDHTPEPVERYGVKLMSMGILLNASEAAAMRGPMIHKYLHAFLTQFNWGKLDFLLVDMPPGTGDAQMSLAQLAPVRGALVVTMPQDVSLAVVRRGLAMFRIVRVPVLGLVENMSYFVGDDGKRYDIFGKGGGERCAAEAGIPFLGSIPIDPRVSEQGDRGEPIVHSHPDSNIAKAYHELANKVKVEIERCAQETAPLPGLEL